MDGDEEFFKVGVWWNGMGVMEITAEVGGKTVASAHMIRDVGIGHIVIVSEAKVMNNGEELFDEVREGHVGVVVSESAPKSCGGESLLAPNDVKP